MTTHTPGPSYGGDLFTPLHAWRVYNFNAVRPVQSCKWCGRPRIRRRGQPDRGHERCPKKGIISR